MALFIFQYLKTSSKTGKQNPEASACSLSLLKGVLGMNDRITPPGQAGCGREPLSQEAGRKGAWEAAKPASEGPPRLWLLSEMLLWN